MLAAIANGFRIQPLDQREVFGVINLVAIRIHLKITIKRRQFGDGFPRHHVFLLQAIVDNLGNRNELHVEPAGDVKQLGPARHRAIRIQNLANHTGGL